MVWLEGMNKAMVKSKMLHYQPWVGAAYALPFPSLFRVKLQQKIANRTVLHGLPLSLSNTKPIRPSPTTPSRALREIGVWVSAVISPACWHRPWLWRIYLSGSLSSCSTSPKTYWLHGQQRDDKIGHGLLISGNRGWRCLGCHPKPYTPS